MNPSRPRLRLVPAAAVLAVCAAAAVAGADDDMTLADALASCAAITAHESRLACYDALAHRASASRPSVPSAASAPLTPPGRVPVPASAGAGDAPGDFGLNARQKQSTPSAVKPLESIKASVTGLGHSPNGRARVDLDNGQSWELDEEDPLLAVGNLITIQRAALGSFLLLTPTRRTHHVRRLR